MSSAYSTKATANFIIDVECVIFMPWFCNSSMSVIKKTESNGLVSGLLF